MDEFFTILVFSLFSLLIYSLCINDDKEITSQEKQLNIEKEKVKQLMKELREAVNENYDALKGIIK